MVAPASAAPASAAPAPHEHGPPEHSRQAEALEDPQGSPQEAKAEALGGDLDAEAEAQTTAAEEGTSDVQTCSAASAADAASDIPSSSDQFQRAWEARMIEHFRSTNAKCSDFYAQENGEPSKLVESLLSIDAELRAIYDPESLKLRDAYSKEALDQRKPKFDDKAKSEASYDVKKKPPTTSTGAMRRN